MKKSLPKSITGPGIKVYFYGGAVAYGADGDLALDHLCFEETKLTGNVKQLAFGVLISVGIKDLAALDRGMFNRTFKSSHVCTSAGYLDADTLDHDRLPALDIKGDKPMRGIVLIEVVGDRGCKITQRRGAGCNDAGCGRDELLNLFGVHVLDQVIGT